MELLTFEVHTIPSSSAFTSSVERKNIPAVFRGCIKDWHCSAKWDPSKGGLDYLLEKVGCHVVEAIVSKSAPIFYGDIRRHERVHIPFSMFIGYCKQQLEMKEFVLKSDANGGFDPKEIYLAQVPIMHDEDGDSIQLGVLENEISKPDFLGSTKLASVNLWMNNFPVRSSTHYDPHHNILCVVSGRKEVVLWPPTASSCLYPMPIHGESSNHSSVELENPDFSLHPRAKESMQHAFHVSLFAGDAIFIPEGWFHQVDSEKLTIAVNFWWKSEIMCNMVEHMDGYYLRRILRRMTDKEVDHMLGNSCSLGSKEAQCSSSVSQHGSSFRSQEECTTCKPHANDQELGASLKGLDPRSLGALQNLVNLVHERINVTTQTELHEACSRIPAFVNDGTGSEHDPISILLWSLDACTLRVVLLAMAHNFPRTLETLLQHLLSPIGAEVLTRKFDELGKHLSVEERDKFFQKFYGAFDDHLSIMDAILSRKEAFALKAFQNVVEKYLGVRTL